MTNTVTISIEALQALREDAAQFHAVKGIRAWAAEENMVTKRSVLARIDALIALGNIQQRIG